MPNFCQPGTRFIHKIQQFSWSILIFCQKTCFLGHPKVKLHHPTDVSGQGGNPPLPIQAEMKANLLH